MKEISSKSISYLGSKIWNDLDKNIKTSTPTNSFKHDLKKTIPKELDFYACILFLYMYIYIYIYIFFFFNIIIIFLLWLRRLLLLLKLLLLLLLVLFISLYIYLFIFIMYIYIYISCYIYNSIICIYIFWSLRGGGGA